MNEIILAKNNHRFKVEPFTKLYFNQIQKYVKDKVVIDFGAGSGILGVYAALCGAKYVYFVETEEKMHDVIKKMCELNGITNYSVKKFYDECEEKNFDVCISKLIGSFHYETGLEEAFKTYSRIIKENEDCIAIPESITLYALQTYNEEIEIEREYLKNFKDVKLDENDFIKSNVLRITSQKSIFKKFGDNIHLQNLNFKDYASTKNNIFKKIKLKKGFNCLNFAWEAYVGHDVFIKHFPNNENDYSSWMYAFIYAGGNDKDYELEIDMNEVSLKEANYFKYKLEFI